MNQVITIDIGNTRAKYAVFEEENMIEQSIFNPYSNDLELLTKKFPNIKKGIISSVGGKIKECLDQLHDIEIITLCSSTALPFETIYENKAQIGSDRLVAVAAALKEKPKQNNLVIDIGTCITYDIIQHDMKHLPGPISPGIKLRFKSMNDYTEKLPLCQADRNKINIICKSTEECLQTGVLKGIAIEIEGFIQHYSNIFTNLNVFIIGGDNIFFENMLKSCIFADSKFTFNGLKYILDYQ